MQDELAIATWRLRKSRIVTLHPLHTQLAPQQSSRRRSAHSPYSSSWLGSSVASKLRHTPLGGQNSRSHVQLFETQKSIKETRIPFDFLSSAEQSFSSNNKVKQPIPTSTPSNQAFSSNPNPISKCISPRSSLSSPSLLWQSPPQLQRLRPMPLLRHEP